MSNIIARKESTDVRVAAVAVKEGELLKLASEEVTPITAQGDDIYGVALEDQDADAEVSVLRYPFFGMEVRLLSNGDISKDDDLEPVGSAEVATGVTRVLFRALESVLTSDGDGQHIRVTQHKID